MDVGVGLLLWVVTKHGTASVDTVSMKIVGAQIVHSMQSLPAAAQQEPAVVRVLLCAYITYLAHCAVQHLQHQLLDSRTQQSVA